MSTLFLFALGCPGFGSQSPPETELGEGPPSWDNGVEDILAAHCSYCHTSPPSGDAPAYFRLDVYEDDGNVMGAFSMAERIVARAGAGTMPPSGSGPSDAELEALQTWYDNGAPETSDTGAADAE